MASSREYVRLVAPSESDWSLNAGIDLELIPDAAALFSRNGRLIAMNRAFEAVFHLKSGFQSAPAVDRLISERCLPAFRSYLEECSSDSAIHVNRSFCGLRGNQSEFPIETSSKRIQITNEGCTILCIFRDISHREGLDEKFRGLLESAPDGIVVVDIFGRITVVNSQAEVMFGYSRTELLGQRIDILIPERYREAHLNDLRNHSRSHQSYALGANQELFGKRKSGEEFPVEISLSNIITDQGTWITSIIRDITERKKVEAQIQASLREKEVLLKEIHHRVKNNLQVTSSLLRLQANHISDPKAKQMFQESQARIRSMALVHEKLYQSPDLSRVDFPEYVESLSRLLMRSWSSSATKVNIRVESDPLALSVETAVPCALIINELMSNCLKHAFPGTISGDVVVRIRKEEKEIVITVSDSGIGLPPDFNWTKSESLGLKLVLTLTKQLKGTITVKSEKGTTFLIRFPVGQTS